MGLQGWGRRGLCWAAGRGQPAPLKLPAQILLWQLGLWQQVQLLRKEPSVGCGIASPKKWK